MKEKEKVFRWDVTLSFEVSAETEDKAKAIIEEELGFLDPILINNEVWYGVTPAQIRGQYTRGGLNE